MKMQYFINGQRVLEQSARNWYIKNAILQGYDLADLMAIWNAAINNCEESQEYVFIFSNCEVEMINLD